MIAETTLPPMKLFAPITPQPQPIANRDLVADFLDLSFEMESGKQLPVLTRFEGPISLRVTGAPPATLARDLRLLLDRLQREAGIAITVTQNPDAQITIEAVSRRTLQKVLPQAACFVVPNVSSLSEFRSLRRSPKTDWALLTTRTRVTVVVPNDASPQEVRDCLHEEVAQALGPLNDLYRLPNSVFNDDNVHTILTDFDMLILRATYAPELTSGMGREDVAAKLPAIFARINPNSAAPARAQSARTPIPFTQAIQTALGPGTGLANRQTAADRAVQIATQAGWNDTRRGLAHYTRGRILQVTDPRAAPGEFRLADRFYAISNQTRLHRAFVASQLASYALAAGEPARARALVTPYIPLAKTAQNAALLATLQLLRAEALRAEGRVPQADALRLDSLGWARYGFGADWAVQGKLREIATLRAQTPPS
ncbi:DUF2927 domain-containing protein [Roseobacter denitrificans]|nr:DUF2927 domain-containing protein [Roseobacter denitrificans]